MKVEKSVLEVAFAAQYNEMQDNRFAVINGILFTCISLRDSDKKNQYFVEIHDADGCFNASEGEQLKCSYTDEYFMGLFLFETEEDQEKFFVSCITDAMSDCVELRKKLGLPEFGSFE